MGAWARLTAVAAVLGTGLAVVSGAAGWDTAHRVLAALALPPLAALTAIAWVSARKLLPTAIAALVLFGSAALVTGSALHLTFASLAFGATALLAARTFRGHVEQGPLRDYVTLTKPRIMSLLLLTGGAGAFVGAAGVPAWGAFAVTMIGLALACGGSSALNHYLDRDIDRLMGTRTAGRPVASGRLAPADGGAAATGRSCEKTRRSIFRLTPPGFASAPPETRTESRTTGFQILTSKSQTWASSKRPFNRRATS